MNWLKRARREIQESARRPTAITAERTPTAVMAAPYPVLQENSAVSIGSNGGAPTQQMLETEDAREDFEERAAIIEFDGGQSRDEAEREARELILSRHQLH
jgi:hypothetical protein